MPSRARPTREELDAAFGGSVPDLVGPGMRILLCGINPSLASAAIGHHFGNPANRLWPALHFAGFVPRRLHPTESAELLAAGVGVTNFVNRATATAAEVSRDEIRAGVSRLRLLVQQWRPPYVAFLGLGAYRVGFDQPRAQVGRRPEPFAGATVWLLPNPSGLNAHYQLPELVTAYAELRQEAFAEAGGAGPVRRGKGGPT